MPFFPCGLQSLINMGRNLLELDEECIAIADIWIKATLGSDRFTNAVRVDRAAIVAASNVVEVSPHFAKGAHQLIF